MSIQEMANAMVIELYGLAYQAMLAGNEEAEIAWRNAAVAVDRAIDLQEAANDDETGW